MRKFEIAGITIGVTGGKLRKLGALKKFSTGHRHRFPDLTVDMQCCGLISKPPGKVLLDTDIQWFYSHSQDKRYWVCICKKDTDEIVYRLEVNNDWSKASIVYTHHKLYMQYSLPGLLGGILFRSRILFHQGIVIHASAIEAGGRGILFSAPSGTGKSTQASLWEKYKQAKVLNDDTPAVRIVNHRPFAFGTPWSGSSSKFVNGSVPIHAIVMLEQAPYNAIRQLSRQEAVIRLMPRCFLPYFDDHLMETATNIVEQIIETTPVYLLECRPDKEAVDLVYQHVNSAEH